MKRILVLGVLVLLTVANLGLVALAEEGKGCGVDNCHALGTKYTLAVESKNVKGHPPVAETALFEDCIKCHKGEGKLAFGPILHKAHYHEGTNHFTSDPKRTCQSCHKVSPATGAVTVQYAK